MLKKYYLRVKMKELQIEKEENSYYIHLAIKDQMV